MPRNLEILLTDDVFKLGDMGDIVAVKPGYARNYLLPRKKAILADRAAKRQVDKLQAQARVRDAERQGKAQGLKAKIDGLTIRILAKVAHDDVLFGGIGVRDIVRKLAEQGLDLDPRMLHMHESIKRLGVYKVPVRLHKSIESSLTIEVGSIDPTGKSMDEIIREANGETAPAAEPAAATAEAAAAKPTEGKAEGKGKGRNKDTAKEPAEAKAEAPAKTEAKPAKTEEAPKKGKNKAEAAAAVPAETPKGKKGKA